MNKITIRRKQTLHAKAEVQEWQTEHIQEGIRQADAGEFASKAQVAAAFARRQTKKALHNPSNRLPQNSAQRP